jgi:hypothetical protein
MSAVNQLSARARQQQIPPALATIAAGRDHIDTREYAHALSKSPQTVRKNYCLTGHCYGIKPIKVGNRLLWPVAETAALLQGDAQ